MIDVLPTSMRVARLYAWGDVRIEREPVPSIGPGEALVRIEACGVCGSDALTWYVEQKAPVVLGHEPAGTVMRVGDGVSNVHCGDRVFVHHHAPCGMCAECRRHLWSNCATWRGSQLVPGGFAEYVRVPRINLERDTLLLPDDMTFDVATFIEPLACCIRAVQRHGAIAHGDVALIIGLGSMGLLMVQLARVLGAGLVIGSDFVPARRACALGLGADRVLDPGCDDVAAVVRDASDGRGADVVIVCPGEPAAVSAGIDAAAPGGRVVCFTPLPPGGELSVDANHMYFREITLTQSYSCGPDETRQALALLRDRRLEVEALMTHRAGLEGVADALERARGKGNGIKSVIHPAE